MAYVTAQWNVLQHGVAGAPSLWIGYGTDVHTDVDAADFVSDGVTKGMKTGDVVIYVKTSATIGATLHSVVAGTSPAMTLTPAILA
jgi:broad specificity polyphosphatase/5'/3'-nucleotidase SurE